MRFGVRVCLDFRRSIAHARTRLRSLPVQLDAGHDRRSDEHDVLLRGELVPEIDGENRAGRVSCGPELIGQREHCCAWLVGSRSRKVGHQNRKIAAAWDFKQEHRTVKQERQS